MLDLMDEVDHRTLVQRHLAESLGPHQPASFEDSLRRSGRFQQSRRSLPAVRRLSLNTSALSSFGFNPGHEIVETTVEFTGVIRVDNHCAFQLHVDTGKEQFELQRRYSQFRQLRQQLLVDGKPQNNQKNEKECTNGACLQLASQLETTKFPHRKLRFKFNEVRIAEERADQLQHFLDLILAVYRTAPKRKVRCCVNSQCRVLESINSFLDIKDTELPEWKTASIGTSTGDDDTPPSTTSPPSRLDEELYYVRRPTDSPQPLRTSAMCLEELYTITEASDRHHN